MFVGRERELAELRAGLDDALAGRGGLFLVVGEPGIGKTRLAAELADHASGRGARVLWGRCWEGEGAPPYWPWVQLLRSYLREADAEAIAREMGSGAPYVAQIVPEVRERLGALPPPATSLESDHARFALFDAIASFLTKAADTKPLLLTLDDLHWADRASLLLLQFVAHELHHARILILGTYREAEARQAAEVMDVLAVVGRDAHHLPLRGLSEAEVGQLIEAIAGRPASEALTRRVRQATEGNPFFVDELARLLAAEGRIGGPETLAAGAYPVPQGVREAIRRRLKPCSDECRRVLSVACVVGREFDLATLEQVCDLPIERLLVLLGEVLAGGMVAETSAPLGRFSFSHALVRETLYDDLGAAERASLHRRVGETLEGLYSTNPEPHLAELAHHFLRAGPAGDSSKSIDYAIRAGRRASSVLAYEEAARLFEIALGTSELQEKRGEAERYELLLALGDAQRRSGDTSAAVETCLRAVDVARKLSASELLARAALAADAAKWERGGIPDADLLEEALHALGPQGSALRARLLGRLANALTLREYGGSPGGPVERRVSLAREAIETARKVGDPTTLAITLHARLETLFDWDNLGERLAVATELLERAREAGNRELMAMGHVHRMWTLLGQGDLTAVDAEIEAYARLTAELREPWHVGFASLFRSMRALHDGRFEDTERLVLEVRAIAQRVSSENWKMTWVVGAQFFALRDEQGRLGEIEPGVRANAERYPGVPAYRAGLALLETELGRQDEARLELERMAGRNLTDLPRDLSFLATVARLARVCAFLRDARRAALLYDLLLPYGRLNVGLAGWVSLGSASRFLGLLATTMSRWDEAAMHFEDALGANARMRAIPALAHTRYDYAQMLFARDDPADRDKALALLGQALETARALGMKGLVEKAEVLKARALGNARIEEQTSIDVVAAAPEGTVTLMFSDIEGFTEMTERLGDAAALQVVRAHNRIVREQVKAHGGSELELQGDGFLLAFAKAGSALQCAIAIQRALSAYSVEHADQPIRVRIGIHTGEPIKEADRFFGKSVILAARIAAQARGGEIVVSSVVKELCENVRGAAFDAGRDVELKGLSEKRRIFRVSWGGEEEVAQPRLTTEAPPLERSLFSREGDYWTIAYEGKAFRLKDSKGLGYLAELLRNPGRELHVAALVGAAQREPAASGGGHAEVGLEASGLGDAGEILDPRAKAEYGRRLEDLRETLEEAERFNDQERAARARAEIEFLSRELGSAVGLGGRDRKAASAVERARVNVTLAIKAALRNISEQSPALGRHLQSTIRTGKFCCYTPDPRAPISWST